jgi:hypothetical protein
MSRAVRAAPFRLEVLLERLPTTGLSRAVKRNADVTRRTAVFRAHEYLVRVRTEAVPPALPRSIRVGSSEYPVGTDE